MNDLQIFKSTEFGQVRTVEINHEPYFVGRDVAKALGYTDINHTIVGHVDKEDRVNSKTQGQNVPEFGQRGTWLINESGLYALILGSKLPTAKKFKRWVTSEVLPAIRKTGKYEDTQTIDKQARKEVEAMGKRMMEIQAQLQRLEVRQQGALHVAKSNSKPKEKSYRDLQAADACIGDGVYYEVDGDMLTVKVNLAKSYGESKSGKSITVASSRGNVPIPGGHDVIMGLNIYRRNQ